MIFRNKYVNKERFVTSSGSPEEVTFKLKVDKNGHRFLEPDGKINLYEKIQSFRDSCDINVLLTRFANGDVTALSKAQGIYGDFTHVPTSVQELQQRVVDAERLFYQLPVDIRDKFNHSPSQFYAQIGTDSFNEILGISAESAVSDLQDSVSETKPIIEDVKGGVVSE